MARSRSNRSQDETRAKIEQYETFVDKRLKPDLVAAISLWDKVLEQQKVYSDLAKNIKLLQEQKLTKLRTMINLGSEVYGQAEVPDATKIFVDIGLGFHAEFTLDEALEFISAKDKLLSKQVEQHTAQVASIKAQIKLVVEGIKELMNMSS
jgi:prefoldin alpha subunit